MSLFTRLPEQLFRAISKQTLGRAIERGDEAAVVDQADGIDGGVQKRLRLTRGH